MFKRILSGLLVLVLCAAVAGFWYWQQINRYMAAPVSLQQPIERYQLKKGTSFNQLLADLHQQGVISDPFMVKLYTRLRPLTGAIKAGEYAIEPDISVQQLLQKFVDGRSIQHYFTIVEGTTVQNLRATLLEAADIIQPVSKDWSNQEILAAIGADETHPEGLFLAETYGVERGVPDIELLKRSYQAMQAALQVAWDKRDKSLPYQSPYEALIMASIVEKETAVAQERPRIAGVFVKRLNKGMKLQTDPTVIYGLGDQYRGNITRKHLRTPTPYNTYTIAGLPPTPIALVGKEAIAAALAPERGDWLFFVAKGDGYHQFSTTLAEHNRAVRQYQLKRKKSYRSKPEKP